jgi:addiction module HigA family antidote
MNSHKQTGFEANFVSHPGDTVLEYLEFHGWSQRDLARRTGLPPKTINEICDGKAPITPPTALAFEKVFQRPAHLWLNLQLSFDEAQARQTVSQELEKARGISIRLGKEAIKAFMGVCPRANALLKSKEPAVCWEVAGLFHYAVVREFSWRGLKGPYVFRISVNEYPPPELHDFLKERGSCEPQLIIAEAPVLHIFAKAWQVPKLGPWVADWHKAYLEEDPCPPAPPIRLFTHEGKKEGQKDFTHRDIRALGVEWCNHTYFFTRGALEVYRGC